jgi:NitT/TauT family transport system substrate-binding protein
LAAPDLLVSHNGPLFDLPVLVAIDEGLFDRSGLSVRVVNEGEPGTPRSTDPLARLKESSFESGSADVYNVCEWGSIDRVERHQRESRISVLRAASATQGIVSFDDTLQEPHDLAGIPVEITQFTGSHYTTLQILEGALSRDAIQVIHYGGPRERAERFLAGGARVVTLMEPWLSLALKSGAHLIASTTYRGAEVVSPNVTAEQRETYLRVLNEAVQLINGDWAKYRHKITDQTDGRLAAEELSQTFVRYAAVRPFTPQRFDESYQWMASWDLAQGQLDHDTLVAAS